jgi:hypothetical protein
VVEGASLESLYVGNCIVGSNPILSAEKALSEKALFFVPIRVENSFSTRIGTKKGQPCNGAFSEQFPRGDQRS